MAWFSNKVAVTFIDDATKETIGVTKLPPTDLPESFVLDTTLHLGDVDWSVVDAVPKTRAEYSKTKQLTLRLRRIEMVDPKTILYSLPSICDYIPPIGEIQLTGSECILAEDDWRQFEFVGKELADQAAVEIEAIRRIHENESASVGWHNIHIRRGLEPPIRCRLTLDDLSRIFNLSAPFDGVTYFGTPSRIESGFSFATADGQSFYGLAPAGNVTVLAIAQVSKVPGDSVESVEQLAREFGLDLVHWCRCVRAGSGEPLLRRLLTENADQDAPE